MIFAFKCAYADPAGFFELVFEKKFEQVNDLSATVLVKAAVQLLRQYYR